MKHINKSTKLYVTPFESSQRPPSRCSIITMMIGDNDDR